MTQSFRNFSFQVRTAPGNRLVGLAAPFDSPTDILGIRESIAPGAFDRTLAAGHDILALIDHDPARVIGRTKNRSLTLESTSRGLEFLIDLPTTAQASDVWQMARSEYLGGVSIGFGSYEDESTDSERRLTNIDLREISIVSSIPAYKDTTVEARSEVDVDRDARLVELRKWLDGLAG